MGAGDGLESLTRQAALVRASGLFDESSYRGRRPDLPADADAVLDYLRHGGVAPGPLFDANAYLQSNPDVAAAGVNPLLHYIEYGRAEGRSNVYARQQVYDGKARLIVPLPRARDGLSKLAVVVRVHHPAAFAALCDALTMIPGPFSLLVAAPSEDAASTVAAQAREYGLEAVLDCRVIQANAPDLGPLLGVFAENVLRHDVVLHLVLRAPMRQGAQAQSAAAPIRSAPLIDTFIRTFSDHPNVGLIYPSPPPGAPTWSQWSASAHSAQLFMTEYDLKGQGDLPHPIGSEFWARVDALRPLLEAGLAAQKIIEFGDNIRPARAQVFNRVVGAVARGCGYSFVEYDEASGEMRLDWVGWDIDRYFTESVAGIVDKSRDVDLVSFDVFDTLLIRESAHADSVMRFAGQRLAEARPETASDFFAKRKQAEFAARADKDNAGDVGIPEIYARFARDAVWTDEVLVQARALEEETDERTLKARPQAAVLLAAIRDAGKRIIAVSDTYYSTEQVRALLRREGLEAFFHAFYVSSDQSARKDRGDLWDKVLAQEGVPPARWLHVGDNAHSDMDAALARGLKCVHVLRPIELLTRANLSFEAANWATDLAVGPAVNSLAGDALAGRGRGAGLHLNTAHELGFCVFGPILFGFLQWIGNHPALRSVSSLHFLSREGYLLHRTYAAIRERYPALGLPPGGYLYASRRAALGAYLGSDFDPKRLVSGAGFTGTMKEFLKQRIGLDAPSSMLENLPDAIKLPADEAQVLAALQTLKPHIAAYGAEQLAAYRGYLEQAGFTGSPNPAVIDVGYGGTIQAALQGIEARPLIGFYLGTTAAARQVEERGGVAYGYLAEEEELISSPQPAIAFCMLMEAFLVAPHGQVASFERVGESFAPRFREPTHDAQAAEVLAAMQEGALQYSLRLMEIYGESIWRSAIDQRVLQEPFRAVVEGLVTMPNELRSIFSVEDDFCGVGVMRPMELPSPPWNPLWTL